MVAMGGGEDLGAIDGREDGDSLGGTAWRGTGGLGPTCGDGLLLGGGRDGLNITGGGRPVGGVGPGSGLRGVVE